MTAVVSCANGDSSWIQVGKEGMEGGKTRRVSDGSASDERRQECFKAGRVGRR